MTPLQIREMLIEASDCLECDQPRQARIAIRTVLADPDFIAWTLEDPK